MEMQRLTAELPRNELDFSPDEKFFYLMDTSSGKKTLQRYEANPECTITNGQMFAELTSN